MLFFDVIIYLFLVEERGWRRRKGRLFCFFFNSINKRHVSFHGPSELVADACHTAGEA